MLKATEKVFPSLIDKYPKDKLSILISNLRADQESESDYMTLTIS